VPAGPHLVGQSATSSRDVTAAAGRPADAERAPSSLRDRITSEPTALIVAALAVVVFVVRLTQIHQSLLGDETFTYTDILGRTLPQVVANVHTGAENSPPLFFILAYATAKLGDPTVWIRLPSIFFGAAILPVIYLIGRDTVGRVPGTIAAGAVALSPFSMYYGVEARPYATMAFFTALSTWLLLRAVDRDDRRYWAGYVIAAVLACYSHYTCAFVLVVQGAWSLWACRRRLVVPLLAHAAVIVLYVPWLPYLRGKALAVIAILEPLTVHNVVVDLARPIVGYPYAPLAAIPTYLGLGAVIACGVIGLALLARAAGGTQGGLLHLSSWPRHFWLLVAIGLANPVLLLLYSKVSTDLWLARNLYASMPAQALVLGTIVAVPNRRVAVVLGTVVFAVLAVGWARSVSTSWERPPFRAMARYLDQHAGSRYPIAFASLLGSESIPTAWHGPHRLVPGTQLLYHRTSAAREYLVDDYNTVRSLHLPLIPAAPPGMVFAGRVRYHSAVSPDTQIVVYRRATATR
jgi:uncharacterized membrane protein